MLDGLDWLTFYHLNLFVFVCLQPFHFSKNLPWNIKCKCISVGAEVSFDASSANENFFASKEGAHVPRKLFFKNGSETVWLLTIVSHGLSLQFESIWYILFRIIFSFCLYSKVYLPFPLKTMEPDHYPRTPRYRPVSQNVPTPYLSVSLLSFMVSAPQIRTSSMYLLSQRP